MGKVGYEENPKKMIIIVNPDNKKTGFRTLLTPLHPIIHELTFLLNFLDTPRTTGLFQGLVLRQRGA